MHLEHCRRCATQTIDRPGRESQPPRPASWHGESVTPLRRLYGQDFLIDETLWHGHVKDGRPFRCDGKSGDISFRLLHVFEIRDGEIKREQVWCDLAAIQEQLGCTIG